MRIPKELKIGGLVYKVSIVDQIEETSLSGLTNHEAQTIQIRKMAQGRMEQTLFHEIVHCINNELNEVDTEFWGIGIYQVLKDNKLINETLIKR